MRKYWIALLTFLLTGCTNQGLSSTNIVNDDLLNRFIENNVEDAASIIEWYVPFDASNSVELYAASDCVVVAKIESLEYRPFYNKMLDCNSYNSIYLSEIKEVYKGDLKQNSKISIRDYGMIVPNKKEYDYRMREHTPWMNGEFNYKNQPWFIKFRGYDLFNIELDKEYLLYLEYLEEDDLYYITGIQFGAREVKWDLNTNEYHVLNNVSKGWEKLSFLISNQIIEEASKIEEEIKSRLIY